MKKEIPRIFFEIQIIFTYYFSRNKNIYLQLFIKTTIRPLEFPQAINGKPGWVLTTD